MMVVDCSLASERGPAWINKAMFLFLFDLVWKMVQVAEFLTSPAAYAGNASSLVEVLVSGGSHSDSTDVNAHFLNDRDRYTNRQK